MWERPRSWMRCGRLRRWWLSGGMWTRAPGRRRCRRPLWPGPAAPLSTSCTIWTNWISTRRPLGSGSSCPAIRTSRRARNVVACCSSIRAAPGGGDSSCRLRWRGWTWGGRRGLLSSSRWMSRQCDVRTLTGLTRRKPTMLITNRLVGCGQPRHRPCGTGRRACGRLQGLARSLPVRSKPNYYNSFIIINLWKLDLIHDQVWLVFESQLGIVLRNNPIPGVDLGPLHPARDQERAVRRETDPVIHIGALDASKAGDALDVLVRDADAIDGGIGRERRVDVDKLAIFGPSRIVADLAIGEGDDVGYPSGLHVVEHELAICRGSGGDVASGRADPRCP